MFCNGICYDFGKFTEKGVKMFKNFAFTALILGFISGVFADENTIDFKSVTPQNPQPNSFTPYQTPTQAYFKSTKVGNFEYEFGIGYVMSKFKAEQNWGGSTANSSATGHGADIYLSGSYYAGESFGVIIGVGTELINIDWDEPLAELFCMYVCSLDTNSNDFLMNTYLNFGAFKDIVQGGKNSLRVFGNIGFSINWLSGGFYERTISCSAYSCTTTLETQTSISFPLSVGLRYMFVENHGLEFALKYDLIDWDFTTTTPSGVPSFDTTISRNLSLALRYVYKFD